MFAKLLPMLLILAEFSSSTPATAAILYESGTLGLTGIPRSEVPGGSNVSPAVFVGVRFYLDQRAITTQIGGHFVRNTGANDSFFGAIVALTDENDFPDSGNLSTPDVVGATLLSFPEPSNEIFGAITEPLAPGWYALVFGSGLFGATGSGVALNNGVDIGAPVYIAWQPGTGWFDLADLSDVYEFVDFRFVIEGSFVPEPSSLGIIFTALLPFALHRTSKR